MSFGGMLPKRDTLMDDQFDIIRRALNNASADALEDKPMVYHIEHIKIEIDRLKKYLS